MQGYEHCLLLYKGSNELKELLEAETKRSAEMQVFMKKLDKEMARSDLLLYQMIPKVLYVEEVLTHFIQ